MLPAMPLLTSALITAAAPDPARASETLRVGRYAQIVATRYTSREGLPEGGLTRVAVRDGRVLAVGPNGAATLAGGRWQPAAATDLPPRATGLPDGLPTAVTSAARARGGGWWATTEQGAFRHAGAKWEPLGLPRSYRAYQPMPNVDTVIRQVAEGGDGIVWLATSAGAYLTDGADWWQPLNRAAGMPYEDMLCIAVAPNGDVWGGTTQGAWRLRNGSWRYFWGRRWLPGNEVRDISVGPDGTAWLATDGGVAEIGERSITLADKARHYEELTQKRHDRGGWITGAGLKAAGKPEMGHIPEASDNDGLWTAIYVAAESFRYAATREPEARARAVRGMNALLDLVRLSGYPGFPARAIIRKGETVTGYDPNETVRVPGETDKIWYTSPTHPDVLAKGDTSSDELDGHYFAWYVFNEHVADEAERKELRAVVAAVTDNLLSHDYTLIGHTGRKTRWGVFGPQYLNEDPTWVDERGLNSIEMLCYLRVAHHICGDRRYLDAYNDLIANHHYLINTLAYRRNAPWYAINHSDDELAYCVYYPLLMLERDPRRRAVLEASIAGTWEGGPITAGLQEENGPFYSFIFGATTGRPCRAQAAVETLRDWPWELVNWEIRNTQRTDITLRAGLGVARTETDRVLPASERRLMRWATNPWQPDGGGDGTSEEDGAAWLLPYWLGRYHALIAEK